MKAHGRGSRSLWKNKSGQSVMELAIFGSLVLFLFALLLSYMQRLNDQQYVKMEAFRRALEKACTYQGETSEGAGASVQYTMLETRRHTDLNSGFRKGSPSTTGHSASVFWAIPKLGAQADNLTVYKIHENEREWKYKDLVADPKKNSLRIEDTEVITDTEFEETIDKQEDASSITNTRNSKLKDTITTKINYTIRKKDSDDDPDNDEIVEGPNELWNVTQGGYLDADGQYKYSQQAVDNVVERGKIWQTSF